MQAELPPLWLLRYKGKNTADGTKRIEDGTIKIDYEGQPLLLVVHLEHPVNETNEAKE